MACTVLSGLDKLAVEHAADAHGDGAASPTLAGDGEPYLPPPTTCLSSATQCIGAPPAGWTGPLALYDDVPSNAPAACPSPLLEVLGTTADPSDASVSAECVACTCVGDVTCPAATITLKPYQGPSCTQPGGCGGATVHLNVCEAHQTFSCAGSLRIDTPMATATCEVGGGHATLPPPVWSRQLLGCKAPQSFMQQVDCSANEVCVPKPPAPFEGHLCILHSGTVDCPAPYTGGRVVGTGITDTRGCTPCTCNIPSGPCTGGITYTGPDPCGPANVEAGFQTCFFQGDFQGPQWFVTATPPDAGCSVSGGEPTGGLVAAGTATICCVP
jgi:hypothetical protein